MSAARAPVSHSAEQPIGPSAGGPAVKPDLCFVSPSQTLDKLLGGRAQLKKGPNGGEIQRTTI